MIEIWVLFLALVILLVAIDLGLVHRRARAMAPTISLIWACTWIIAAMLFNIAVNHIYGTHAQGAGLRADGSVRLTGAEASARFVTAFLLQVALGLESVFVFSAVFRHFAVPAGFQHRVLLIGLPAAMITKGIIIAAVGGALAAADWAKYIIAALLVLAALRMLLIRQDLAEPDKNLLVRILRRFLPQTSAWGNRLITHEGGRPAMTPLLVAIVLVETGDLLYSLDAVPATFAIASDPFIIFSASIFATLVVRAAYQALLPLLGWIRYVKIGLAAVLMYAAFMIATPLAERVPTVVSLLVVVTAVRIGIIAAALWAPAGAVPAHSPLGPDAERLARGTLRQARKVVILVVGSTTVVVGILMLFGPGPGAVVIPLGLAVLATEFVWARRLLSSYTGYAKKIAGRANDALVKRPRPAAVILIALGTGAAAWAAFSYAPLPRSLLLGVFLPLLIGQTVWAGLTIVRLRELRGIQRRAARDAAADGPSGMIPTPVGQTANNPV